ncbi:hypothetical protein E3A20_10280, partial [Planctomyces bekefii]
MSVRRSLLNLSLKFLLRLFCRLTHDSWYHDLPALPRLPDGSGNWDHPDSLENSLL